MCPRGGIRSRQTSTVSLTILPHNAAGRVLTAFKDAGMNLMGCLDYRKTAWNAEIILVLDEKTPGVSRRDGKRAKLGWRTLLLAKERL